MGGPCPEPATASTSSGIEDYVVEQFFAELGRLELEPVDGLVALDAIEARVDRAQAALEVFRDDPRVIEALGAEMFAAGLAARRAELDDALEELDRAHAMVKTPTGVPRSVELRELWPELTVQEKRRMLGTVIDCVFLRRGRSRHDAIDGFVHICFRGEAPALMPRRGQRGGAYRPTPFRFPEDAPARAGVPGGE